MLILKYQFYKVLYCHMSCIVVYYGIFAVLVKKKIGKMPLHMKCSKTNVIDHLLIERQRAMLLEVYKCIHELGPQYRHGNMFSLKSRAYDYWDPSILTLPKYNTNTHGKKMFYV